MGEIGWIFSCECGNCSAKERRFSGLSRCEDDDVFSIFDAFDKISGFFRTSDDVVIVWIDRSLCSESSHGFSPPCESVCLYSISESMTEVKIYASCKQRHSIDANSSCGRVVTPMLARKLDGCGKGAKLIDC